MSLNRYESIDLSLFDYVDGILYWAVRDIKYFKNKRSMNTWNSRYSGEQCGNIHCPTDSKTEYRRVTILNEQYRYHRIIWLIEKGSMPEDMEIDHIDGDGLNNNISNLRLATASIGRKNMPQQSNNTSGTTGVRFNERKGKYVARIFVDKKEKHLGTYSREDDAIKARKDAEELYGYHKNHGRVS